MDQRVNGCPHPKPGIPFPDIQPAAPDRRPEENVRIVPRLCDSSLDTKTNTRDKDARCSGPRAPRKTSGSSRARALSSASGLKMNNAGDPGSPDTGRREENIRITTSRTDHDTQ